MPKLTKAQQTFRREHLERLARMEAKHRQALTSCDLSTELPELHELLLTTLAKSRAFMEMHREQVKEALAAQEVSRRFWEAA